MFHSYPVYPYAHDFGNSENCGVLTGPMGRIERRIPSVSAIGNWKSVQATADGVGKSVQDILSAVHYVLEYDHVTESRRVEKVIGQKVYDDGAQGMYTHGDSSRYWLNNYSLEMLMVGSGSATNQREYGLHVVTGLPISIYLDDPENRTRVQNALMGTHVFTLNGVQRVMHVESVKVIMEGAGALIAYGSAEDVLQGVIDIGGHTTDLYVANGMKPRAANSKGFSKGVIKASERFNEKFRESFHHTLSGNARAKLLLQHVSGDAYKPVNDKDGMRVPDERLQSLLNSSIHEIGQEIATQVSAIWNDILVELDTVLIVGGGAHYFADDIQQRIRKAKVVHKPEMANCYGYVELAETIVTRMQRSA